MRKVSCNKLLVVISTLWNFPRGAAYIYARCRFVYCVYSGIRWLAHGGDNSLEGGEGGEAVV